jgi:hypothetical protein
MYYFQTSTQLQLFDQSPKVLPEYPLAQFFIKLHYADKAKLHYDFRIEQIRIRNGKPVKGELMSFIIKTDNIFNAEAFLVAPHNTSSARREGTIIDGYGAGAVIHFDEGYFTIPGAKTIKEFVAAFDEGLRLGNLVLLFDGYKVKGKFRLKREKANKWKFKKMPDEYDPLTIKLFADKTSILPEKRTLTYYRNLHKSQKKIFPYLNVFERAKLIKTNNDESFRHKFSSLAERPHKIFPID